MWTTGAGSGSAGGQVQIQLYPQLTALPAMSAVKNQTLTPQFNIYRRLIRDPTAAVQVYREYQPWIKCLAMILKSATNASLVA